MRYYKFGTPVEVGGPENNSGMSQKKVENTENTVNMALDPILDRVFCV